MAQITKTLRKRRVLAGLNYFLHLPPGYEAESDNKWPLILFLHGAGERGDDLESVKRHGIARIVEEQPDFPFITISPQCPADTWWSNHIRELMMLLAEVTAAYAVDESRLYLTGLSMGGFGAWHLGSVYAHRLAAVVPVCGGGRILWMHGFPERVCALRHTPVWAFHGQDDDVVPLSESEVMVETLQACGGNVRFTIYPDTGHDSWTETYNNPELYTWLLQHIKAQPEQRD
jgi:predicted peptidase